MEYRVDHPRVGYHSIEINHTVWQVPSRYVDLKLIGSGAFGQVCSATDEVTGTQVAIKKLSRPFQTAIHAKRTYREIRMLKHMSHDNIISLLDVFTPSADINEFENLYFVSQFMETDLGKVVITKQKLACSQIQLIVYQILRAVKYMHSAGIIHRDLKPSNIALNTNLEVRVLDFGLARYKGYTGEEVTGYVATRWYRAPEIMLNWMHYNHNVDVWSVGCVMAELFSTEPLFKGKDHIDQLTKIMDVLGTPGDSLLEKLTSEDARLFIRSLPRKVKIDLKRDHRFQQASPEAIDLMEKMLDYDPDTRFTAEQALAHPFLSKYGDPFDEPISENYDQSFENQDLSIDRLKELIHGEVQSFVPLAQQESDLMDVE